LAQGDKRLRGGGDGGRYRDVARAVRLSARGDGRAGQHRRPLRCDRHPPALRGEGQGVEPRHRSAHLRLPRLKGGGEPMFGMVALLLFAAFALVGYAISGWAQEREEAKEALGRRLTTMTGASVGGASAALMKDRRLSRIGLFNAILQHLALTKNLVRVIRQAGLKKRVGEVLLYMPLLAAAAFIAATLLLGKLMFAVLAAVFAGLLPLMIVLRLRRRRMALFGEQLPDALDLIRAALQ